MAKPDRRMFLRLSDPDRIAYHAGAAVLGLCLVLGGATGVFAVSDVLTEALCLPLLAVVAVSFARSGNWPRMPMAGKAAIVIVIAIVLIPLVQLIPLPPAVWSRLPGREPVVRGFELAHIDLPWAELSLSPSATRQSFLALLPPLTVFLATLQMTAEQRRAIAVALSGFGVLSIIVGILQLSQGISSPLRFFENLRLNEIVGFYANRNHFAALLYALTLIAGSVAIGGLADGRLQAPRGRRPSAVGPMTIAFLIFAAGAFLIGALLTRSRLGILLSSVAVACILVQSAVYVRRSRMRMVTLGAAVVALIAVVSGLQYNLYEIVLRFSRGITDPVRSQVSSLTKIAIAQYFPFGSGMGTFIPIYSATETPETSVYGIANRAHNDYLEWTLEAGLLAVATIGAGFAWLALANVRAWLQQDGNDGFLARACAAALLLLLAHSIIDYPLRTLSIMALAAYCVGVCAAPAENAPTGRPTAKAAHRTN